MIVRGEDIQRRNVVVVLVTRTIYHGISRQLSGKRNARLYSSVPVENNYTAAWTDPGYIYPETNVTAPSEEMTEEAKDWVDNGSKL